MSEPLDEIEKVFLALSDKTRIRLVDLMRDGEVSVNYLCESLGISQPKVSRHLAYLRAMGMVNTRRDGKWIYYSLSEPKDRLGSQLLRDTLSWVASVTRGGRESAMVHTSVSAPAVEKSVAESRNNISVEPDTTLMSNDLEIYLL